jgi:hypothetical protein
MDHPVHFSKRQDDHLKSLTDEHGAKDKMLLCFYLIDATWDADTANDRYCRIDGIRKNAKYQQVNIRANT